jgi:hypothetical protein
MEHLIWCTLWCNSSVNVSSDLIPLYPGTCIIHVFYFCLTLFLFYVSGLLRGRHSTTSSCPPSSSNELRYLYHRSGDCTARLHFTRRTEQLSSALQMRAEQKMFICRSQTNQVPAVLLCDRVMQQEPLASEYTTVHTIETFGDRMGGLQHQAVNIEGK